MAVSHQFKTKHSKLNIRPYLVMYPPPVPEACSLGSATGDPVHLSHLSHPSHFFIFSTALLLASAKSRFLYRDEDGLNCLLSRVARGVLIVNQVANRLYFAIRHLCVSPSSSFALLSANNGHKTVPFPFNIFSKLIVL